MKPVHLGTSKKCPDYQGVLIHQVILLCNLRPQLSVWIMQESLFLSVHINRFHCTRNQRSPSTHKLYCRPKYTYIYAHTYTHRYVHTHTHTQYLVGLIQLKWIDNVGALTYLTHKSFLTAERTFFYMFDCLLDGL